MIKKYLDKIRTMDKQALTAFGTCGLFFLLALVQLLILAFSSFGRSWDHILLLLVDIVIGAIACYMGFRWQNKQSRPAAAPQQAPKARPAQPSPKTRPTQQLQKARPAQPSSMEMCQTHRNPNPFLCRRSTRPHKAIRLTTQIGTMNFKRLQPKNEP